MMHRTTSCQGHASLGRADKGHSALTGSVATAQRTRHSFAVAKKNISHVRQSHIVHSASPDKETIKKNKQIYTEDQYIAQKQSEERAQWAASVRYARIDELVKPALHHESAHVASMCAAHNPTPCGWLHAVRYAAGSEGVCRHAAIMHESW